MSDIATDSDQAPQAPEMEMPEDEAAFLEEPLSITHEVTHLRLTEDVYSALQARVEQDQTLAAALAAARERRDAFRLLASWRESQGIPQSRVAVLMGTSQPAIARLEAGNVDLRVSTLERYTAAIGLEFSFYDWAAQSEGISPNTLAVESSAPEIG